MSYDNWKTRNPADEFLGVVERIATLRPVEYRKVRVRSDATTTLWGYESRTYPTETVELIARAVRDGGITDEAKLAEILHILARSTLAGEVVP